MNKKVQVTTYRILQPAMRENVPPSRRRAIGLDERSSLLRPLPCGTRHRRRHAPQRPTHVLIGFGCSTLMRLKPSTPDATRGLKVCLRARAHPAEPIAGKQRQIRCQIKSLLAVIGRGRPSDTDQSTAPCAAAAAPWLPPPPRKVEACIFCPLALRKGRDSLDS